MFFKTKDLMTVGNIAGGVGCVLVAMEGMAAPQDQLWSYTFWSAFMILIAFFFDAFDGVVARWLNQMNDFGAEFDNVADLVAYSVAPSFLLYFVYSRVVVAPGLENLPMLRTVVAVTVAMVPILSGCIRFARFNIRKLDLTGYWIGFPRPASALLTVAIVNSHLFVNYPFMIWVAVAIVFGAGFMNLTTIPFISHHGREFSWYLKIVLNFVLLTVVVSVILGVFLDVLPDRLVFDWVVIWLSYYMFIGWTDVPTATRVRVRKATADWND